MKQLMCEMCCSTDILKQDGVFVCQACGCKYSVEEAERMMIDNFLLMAKSAYKGNNKAEAETFCNKILEIVPDHPQAWLIKGRAAGWQSTLVNIRLSEAINCFANAIACTDESEKDAIIEECRQGNGTYKSCATAT